MSGPDTTGARMGPLLGYLRWSTMTAARTGGCATAAARHALDLVWAKDPGAHDALAGWFATVPAQARMAATNLVLTTAWSRFDPDRDLLVVAVLRRAVDQLGDHPAELGELLSVAPLPGGNHRRMVCTAAAVPALVPAVSTALSDTGRAWPDELAAHFGSALRAIVSRPASDMTPDYLRTGDAGRTAALALLVDTLGPARLAAVPCAWLDADDATVIASHVGLGADPMATEVFAHVVAHGDELTLGQAADLARGATTLHR